MIKKIITTTFSFVAIAIAFYSCDTTEPDNGKINPPGYQEDIPWPSLADSPWPTLHGNTQSTGRGIYALENIGSVEWEFSFNEDLVSGVVIGPDSSIYFITEMSSSAGLYCVSYSGDLKWKKETGGSHRFTTPIITSQYNIIVLDYNILKSFNKNGDLNWEHEFINAFFWQESLQIDKDGNIYLIDLAKNLYKINADGYLEWQLNNQDIQGGPQTFGISFSPDGKTLYIPGDGVSLLAVNITSREVEWSFGNESMVTSPLIDNQGNIYCQLNDNIVSLNSEGQQRWIYKYDKFVVNDNKPSLDNMGNIYFVSEDTLYSLDFEGNLRWSKELIPSTFTDSPLVCDQLGNIYVGFFTNSEELIMRKYNNAGTVLWEINFDTHGEMSQLYASPALGYNNEIIFPAQNQIFAIK